ncbi:YihY/virulence factor BrkB family protein [Rhodoflexus caldus]|uniref:YihY/virulence factor BrkB family protein n=1 Tax=Rhodoflexus caldus TaxID=2891236 RepID=UPI00202A6C80|nr:YihY/virulence factor BrkB family protein [Rhodoflexus caldus]
MNGKYLLTKIGRSIRVLARNFIRDDCFTHSAALAYYTTFSLAPILFIIVSVSGFFFGQEAAQGEIYRKTADLIGEEAARLIESIIRFAYLEGNNPWALTAGIATVIIGATSVFSAIHNSLNRIWGIKTREQLTFWQLLHKRFMGLLITFVIGLLIIVLIIAEQTLTIIYSHIEKILPEQLQFIGILTDRGLIFSILLLLFWLIYQWLSDVKMRWSHTFYGAVFTTIFFGVGRWLIGMYIGYSSINLIYGATASLAVLLVWIYYSAIIFLMGAEFIKSVSDFSTRNRHKASISNPTHSIT